MIGIQIGSAKKKEQESMPVSSLVLRPLLVPKGSESELLIDHQEDSEEAWNYLGEVTAS